MRIEHIALWVNDLDKMRSFYENYFAAKPNEKYRNNTTNFTSYFLSFESGCRLELMKRPDITERSKDCNGQTVGLAHFAISVGSKKTVDALTKKLLSDGVTVLDSPRTTGDGYYESVILDPENNRVEITE